MDEFTGYEEEPEENLTLEQKAHNKRQKQKADRHEKVTKDLTMMHAASPEAYNVLKEYLEVEIYTMGLIIANCNDSDILLKYSGAMKTLKELLEKLDLYKDFS